MHPKQLRRPLTLLTVLALSCCLAGCDGLPTPSGSSAPLSKTSLKLDTVVTISLYDSQDEAILDHAMELCDTYEKIFSRTDSESELARLNARTLPPVEGTTDTYELSDDLAELISQGLTYTEDSSGALDIALAPLTSLWNFKAETPRVPSAEEIQDALAQCDLTGVTLSDNQITLPAKTPEFDLGALAKGYIADRLKDYLVSQGVHRAIISLGGNILCVGEKASDTPFTVGIQKPFDEQGQSALTLQIADQSVVTSGIYQRYFEEDGVLYHHILDSETGYPVQNDLASVSILSDASVDGDALSTTCFALGLKKGLDYLAALPDVYGIFLTKDGQVICSEDLPASYHMTVLS